MKKKVVVGMSGGVDSSVAALLLKEQGYEVIGITLKVWDDNGEHFQNEGGCCSLDAVEDARSVAYKLDIPFYVLNFKRSFKEKVIDYFLDEYLEGRTPNPCVRCNKLVRFDEFLRKSMSIGAEYLSTGHYAKIEKVNDRFLLKKPKDSKKDQTYMLYNLTQFQLEHTLMPLADYTKTEIREIAEKNGLAVHNKRDSEEICFIPDNDHGSYIKRYGKKPVIEGNFVDRSGNVLGKHKGIVYYTIGQRKGLGLSLGTPVFVTDIDPIKNEVIIGNEEELFKRELIAKDINLIAIEKIECEMEVEAKVRYSTKTSKARIIPMDNNRVKVVFYEPQRAITSGQSVVFYDNDIVIGGGIIE